MFLAKGRYDWDQTAALLAQIVNVNRDPKKGKPADPAELNPFRSAGKKPARSGRKLSVPELVDTFLGKRR